jgi:tRNA-uridine 2-sulfurtransferase
MKPTAAVALSGGIDSLVTAYLLKSQGYHVIGLHFLSGAECNHQPAEATTATSISRPGPEEKARAKLHSISEQLQIPLEVVDLSVPFQNEVINYFIHAYGSGQTPNPCLVCNPIIKFGHLLEAAERCNATKLATGHYARVHKDSQGQYHLFKGADPVKEQSYFLSRLTQRHLSRALFPLGGMTKHQTRQLAAQHALVPAVVRESQDVCFIRDTSYADFLSKQSGFQPEPGPIVTSDGRLIGTHRGLHHYTVGQRRGINCPAARPYYVLALQPDHNRLVVGYQEDLLAWQCRVDQINWIGRAPTGPLNLKVKIRYRHRAVAARLTPSESFGGIITFDRKQAAVTPGQGAAFYQDDELLGGGWIQPLPG